MLRSMWWKRIVELSAVVQAVTTLVAMIGAGAVWALKDLATLAGCVAVAAIGFFVFMGLKFLYTPKIKFLSEEKYDALKVLGQVKEGTVYMITVEKKDKV